MRYGIGTDLTPLRSAGIADDCIYPSAALLPKLQGQDVVISQRVRDLMPDAATKLQQFAREGIRFIALTDDIDTGTERGRKFVHILQEIQPARAPRLPGIAAQVARFRELEASGIDPRDEFSELSSHTYYKIRKAARQGTTS